MTTVLADDLSCVLDYVSSLGATAEAGSERRIEPRHSQSMIVELLPLDHHLRPCGDVRLGVSRDVSRHGASLFADVPEGTRYLRVRFPIQNGQRLDVLIELVWWERYGTMAELGGSVVNVRERFGKSILLSGLEKPAELCTAPA